ncbi:hypothetical protein IEO21_01877 [Rhodonia placenta]|uniref:DUF3074 domain-containing protein n=1 Tax=Rhodonia placenta TaxID=104341 RepID=A0A8H7P935_9APHY|nr:hypothetical protein IEO21_01877 [Postia placenta]
MSSDYQLSIKPLKLSELPSEDAIITLAKTLLDSTTSWKSGKTYYKVVKTCSRPKGPQDGAPWHCRVSEHAPADATFDEFWGKLGVDKAENEMKFIADIKKVKLIKQISPTQAVWSLYYTFTPPVSPRVFTVLQTTYLDAATPKTGIIVSIPIDLSDEPELVKLEEKGVKGRYVSVERLQELENGNVEWRMATSSTPGGKIPSFIAESTMDSAISQDVTHFLHWFHSVRPKPEEAQQDAAA